MIKKANRLITFSGLDGAGKTTVINQLLAILNNGEEVAISFTIYFDVSIYAILRKLRNSTKSKNIKNDKSNKKTSINDNGNFGLILSFFRNRNVKLIIIYIDSIIAWFYFIYYCLIKNKILILDRFYYDFLIDLGLEGIDINKHYKYLDKIYPKPSTSLYLDIDPAEAYDRKGEYNVNYLYEKRVCYNNIFKMTSNALIIFNDNLDKTIKIIISSISNDK